jgi:hypothetical protein
MAKFVLQANNFPFLLLSLFLFIYIFLFYYLGVGKTVFFFFLHSSGCPGIHSVDQGGLELRDLSASASQVLGSKACTTITWPTFPNFNILFPWDLIHKDEMTISSHERLQISSRIPVRLNDL